MTVPRTLAWFSCGDASAVACLLALRRDAETVIARIVLPTEHPDNDRFAADCARWYGREIVELQDPEKRSTWDVWEQRRYIADIGMRMLQPPELYRAQGFPDDVKLIGTKSSQVALCGNSVSPPVAAAIVRANFAQHSKRAAA